MIYSLTVPSSQLRIYPLGQCSNINHTLLFRDRFNHVICEIVPRHIFEGFGVTGFCSGSRHRRRGCICRSWHSNLFEWKKLETVLTVLSNHHDWVFIKVLGNLGDASVLRWCEYGHTWKPTTQNAHFVLYWKGVLRVSIRVRHDDYGCLVRTTRGLDNFFNHDSMTFVWRVKTTIRKDNRLH